MSLLSGVESSWNPSTAAMPQGKYCQGQAQLRSSVGASSDGGRNMNNDGKKKNDGKRGDGLWADHADFAIC